MSELNSESNEKLDLNNKENNEEKRTIKKKDKVYYARIINDCGIFDVCELIIRTVEDDWFVGIEKHNKQAFLFSKSDLNKIIFFDRKEALYKVKEAESKRKEMVNDLNKSNEIYYEEY